MTLKDFWRGGHLSVACPQASIKVKSKDKQSYGEGAEEKKLLAIVPEILQRAVASLLPCVTEGCVKMLPR